MTSHWDTETCLWLFQLRSIRSSPRDLILGLGGQIPWTKTYRRHLRINFESNDSRMSQCTVSAEKYMIFRTPQFPQFHYIHQKRATIALGHLKSVLEPFQRLRWSSQNVLSKDSSSLAYWNTFVRLFWSRIFCQRHKRLLSGIQITELFPLLSAQRKGLRWSRLFDYTPHLVSTSRPFQNMIVYYKHQAFSDTNNNLWRRHNIAENLNLNFSGFWCICKSNIICLI